MGTCLSKKKPSSSSSSSAVNKNNAVFSSAETSVVVPIPATVTLSVDPNTSNRSKTEQQQHQLLEEQKQEEPTQVKKEIFLIKHRKSHDDRDRNSSKNPITSQNPPSPLEESESASASAPSPAPTPVPAVVRTSSCTKEEVDAILIQCGRLSRSSSGKAASSSSASRSRKYSGSKRSYDFDNNVVDDDDEIVNDDGVATMEEKRPRERQRSHRRSSSRGSPSPQERRRRTPSRERDSSQQQQRSSSRERRVSRSPGRRGSTETATPSSTNSNRPGKMVSVPATVSSSLVMDKSNNGDSASNGNANGIKRISVKRNVGEAGSRGAASPRSQSPARGGSGNGKSSNELQQQQPSLSRNSSRKAEQSPYRRNPLSEIDPNSLAYPNPHNNNSNSRAQSKSKRETSVAEGDDYILVKELPTQAQKPNAGTNNRSSSRVTTDNKNSQPQQAMVETTVVIPGADNKPQQTLTRSRSSRRSRDLDINVETLLNPNPTPSYTRLLLEDIQNFHQKNTTTTTTVVSLPPCVGKACSILEAVADLNSATGSNLSSSAFSEDQFNKGAKNAYSPLSGPTKDPFVESELIVGCDDLTEPSFHKYVTVRRGGGTSSGLVVDAEDQESSGSNSFVGSSQVQNWGLSSSSSEPNSVDSTDCWTSRSNTREEERLSGRKKDSHSAQPQYSGGIGRGRLVTTKGHTVAVVAAAAST